MASITACLWFNGRIEEAAAFYVSVFKDAKITSRSHYGEGAPSPKGTPMAVTLDIFGQPFMLLNGGPHFSQSEAVSFMVPCETQDEVDYYWSRLTADGGQENVCGWLKDKFGVSWQIVPSIISRVMQEQNAAKTERLMKVVMDMRKPDVAALTAAVH
ncbi:MAG: VOC family protein [Alphaproteobacteria bacterium]|nr:VOC family protein [Alphaproteobacteria bacterium]